MDLDLRLLEQLIQPERFHLDSWEENRKLKRDFLSFSMYLL